MKFEKIFGENCLLLKWVMMISTPTMTLKQQIGKVLFRQLWRFHTHDEIEREAWIIHSPREGVFELPVIAGHY